MNVLRYQTPAAIRSTRCIPRRVTKRWNSISQRQGSDRVRFPGAIDSKFTTNLDFTRPSNKKAMPTYRILDQDGVVVDKSREPSDISNDHLIKMYKDMLSVSIMDLIMFDAQRQGRISFYMVSAGEEGIAVGSTSALDSSDPIFAQYRETGIFKYRGFTPADFMNQLYANKHDPGLGRNMPVHYGSTKYHIHTISSPLATQIPQASGAAYAVKMQNAMNPKDTQRCVACYFGEGAASEGDFHAALNIAATRKCPVIFICRNNGYAISTPTLEQYRGDGIASRGVGYGIDTIRVDGNDILAVREVTKEARKMCLEDGGKPVLIEAMSYRVSHHSTSDDSFAYRAKVEVEDWKRRDNPITRLRKWMEGKGIWDEEKEKEARTVLKKEILEAFKQAEKEKRPALRNMMEGVYEELTEEQKEQMEKLRSIIEKYPDEYDVSEYEGGLDSLKN
ncbi:MAG: putative fungal-specific transcription factor [Aureobasidium pullulans]|uniref:2-oxoisovalerate dehydrogenase subunit alpha n=2 Tax=Aureobasidium pullulans TaxID=5580 RepID=A0A1A7MBN0_AURPU|nr:MAG: putative fungal-specific transcription factor [Aureobasidium pullulans]THW51816.1 thiamine diphosphate-binding protein [Aureobasidium pullulans]THW93183.1 thiamine diphosphate-binding protein [Aureobasidium pullulans]THZ52126.1 thiamine diphosphate-binding protein [Aureobasidium pullulans]TIA82360.1 thiamine diphosphate-binding protein [Aureobasidium pullulans]